jgi:3-deoxy-D-manno-octulosonic-acid transferase
VGEVRVGAILAHRLPAEWPLLVTTVTPTGQQQAQAMMGGRAAVTYLPLDLGFAIRRFLDRFQPRALVLVEGDYWPLLLRHVARRRLPVVVVNGRVGERTFRRLRRFPRVAQVLFGRVDRFAVQTTDDRERLVALSVDPQRIVVTGNLKFDADPPPAQPEVEALLTAAADGRPILIAGSTMGGEETQVLEAFAFAGGTARALLVLAPRHPERWLEVEQLCARAGLEVARRSALPGRGRPDVVLLDSLGELPALYRLAHGAFIGGTLVPTGGHNPLEPALHGVPVAVGPSMDNFRQMATEFDLAAGWRRVQGSGQLAEFFTQALEGDLELRAAAARGRELVAANRGAAERTLQAIRPSLDKVMG